MRINIGPYKNWVGPYQIAEALCFWAPKKSDEYGYKSKPDWVHEFGEFLAHGFNKKPTDVKGQHSLRDDRPKTLLYKFCLWVESKRKRKIEIRIDRYDTWNMGDTLALIIVPMLKQLKKDKHGSPFTDDEDVPEHLRSTNAPPKENEWDTDELHFARWDWIMDEMIWAFEQIADEDNDDQFHSGNHDYYFEDTGETFVNSFSGKEEGLSRMVEGPNHTAKYDAEGHKKHMARIANGTRLFGKYYQNLWD